LKTFGDKAGADRGSEGRGGEGKAAYGSWCLNRSVERKRSDANIRFAIPRRNNSGQRKRDFSLRFLAAFLCHCHRPTKLGGNRDSGSARNATDAPQKEIVFRVLDEGSSVALGDSVTVIFNTFFRFAHSARDALAVPLSGDSSDDSAAVHQGEREAHFHGRGNRVLEDEGEGTV
jgi:hypothetical protein